MFEGFLDVLGFFGRCSEVCKSSWRVFKNEATFPEGGWIPPNT